LQNQRWKVKEKRKHLLGNRRKKVGVPQKKKREAMQQPFRLLQGRSQERRAMKTRRQALLLPRNQKRQKSQWQQSLLR
ncbi:hypothetical protein DK853_36850, partial [Klebsiella oxytoca]